MVKGIRLTTGAEFALRDAPPTPVQLDRVEPLAREIFPLGARVDAEPWLGRRPCLPDMLPMIGRAPQATRACGSTSATTTWASRWGPSPAGCWPR